MSRAAALVRSLLIVLLLAQSFAVGAMEARAALTADAAAKTQAADDDMPPCHRAAKADQPSPAADCCSHGACRCLGLMLALPQIEMPSPRAEAPSEVVAAPVLSPLPPLRPERPLRPPSV